MPTSSRSLDSDRLKTIKAVHTAVWFFFVICILGIPVASWRNQHSMAFCMAGIVFIEVVVLVFNGWRCPLTPIAARYTSDRQANFDIYLPVWLAKHNKLIFGVLYAAGVVFALARWSQGAR